MVKNIRLSFITILLIVLYQDGYAVTLLDSLWESAQRIPSDTARVTYLNNTAKTYFLKDVTLSISLLDKAKEVARSSNDVYGQALTLKNRGSAYFYMNQYDQTKKYWLKSLKLYEQIQDQKGIGDLSNNVGLVYQRMGKTDSSLLYHLASLQIRQEMKDSVNIANSHANLGGLYRVLSDFNEAQNHYIKALKIYETKGSVVQTSSVLNSLGILYKSIKDYPKGLSYFFQALELRKDLQHPLKTGGTLNNIATCYEHQNKLDSAIMYYEQALVFFEPIKSKRNIAGVYSNLANIYKNQNQHLKSAEYYERALQIFLELKDTEGLAIVQTNLGNLKLKLRAYNEAHTLFEKGLIASTTIGSVEYEMSALKGLADCNAYMGNIDKSLEFNRRFIELNDSIFSIKSAEKIAEIQEMYEVEKREKEVATLKNEVILKQQRYRQAKISRNWAIGLSVSLFFLILLLFNRYQMRKKIHIQKEALLRSEKEEFRLLSELKQKETDAKNRELSSYSTAMLEKSNLLNKINHQLIRIKIGEVKNTSSAINDLSKLIDNNLGLDESWNKFKLHFESVHPGFFDYLASHFPKLTQNDLKNCAYIRMNLSTKEIALLLNIDPKSIPVMRSRLKKKLELTQEDDLATFIAHIH